MERLSDKYLTFDEESRKLLDPKVAELLLDTFDKVYGGICEFFNHGELREVVYKVDPEYDGIAAVSGGRVVVNPEWFTKHPWDIDCMTHELVHVAQNYGRGSGAPGWIVEGLADYGRAKFGLYNKEEGWSLPKYRDNQSYTNSYRVTAAFFVWVEETLDAGLPKDLNDTIKAGNYKDNYFADRTGKTIDELWTMYANANESKSE